MPGVKNNKLVLGYQEQFMRKLLSYSLKYPNILYTMDNETRVPFKWGSYWSAFIKKEASAKGIKVETSEMWDDNKLNSTRQRQSFDNPQVYSFLDVSQNNRNFNQDHWDNLQWARKYIAKAPRPMNNTKIYAGGNSSWGSGDAQQGVERFWRNIIGGAASSRFHRPPKYGLGLNTMAKRCIAAARKLESRIKPWEVTPRMDLLSSRSSDEAYLAAAPGQKYALYFTKGGSIKLDLKAPSSAKFELRWINIGTGQWGATATLTGGSPKTITAPGSGGWAAAIVKK